MNETGGTARSGSREPVPVGGRADQSQVRTSNMGLILRHLRSSGGRSRARLAVETGLSKATISSLIGDLAERGLVREDDFDRGAVGRPGMIVQLDGSRIGGMGVEINAEYVAVTGVDLTGTVICELSAPIPVRDLPVGDVLDQLAASVNTVRESMAMADVQVVAITAAPPGVIDYSARTVKFAANLGWRDVPIVDELARRLGRDAPPIHLENDAKASAIAEYAAYAPEGIKDLVYLTGDAGVGASMISAGQLVRGWSGFSGEVGHLQLDPTGRPCTCGRTGCWEGLVGLAAFLRLAAPDDADLHDAHRPLDERLSVIQQRAEAGDPRTLEALATIVSDLTRGLTILVDVLNPRVLVLGGYFAYFGDFIIAPLSEALDRRRIDGVSGVIVAVTRKGLTSASRGGALLAIEEVFTDPTVFPGVR